MSNRDINEIFSVTNGLDLDLDLVLDLDPEFSNFNPMFVG